MPLPREVDLQGLACAIPSEKPSVWLDSARVDPMTGRWSLLAWDPWLSLSARGPIVRLTTSESDRRWRDNPINVLDGLLRRYEAAAAAGPIRSAFGLVGYLGYEMNGWLERLPARRRVRSADGPLPPSMPDMQWYGMRQTVLVDHLEGCSWLISQADPHRPARQARSEAAEELELCQAELDIKLCPATTATPTPKLVARMHRKAFEAMVRKALRAIADGEIFQANVSQQFLASWQGAPLELYLRLRALNPSPFACLMRWGERAIISCSPERLVRVRDGWVDTRPIAGTRPRGKTVEEDATNSFELLMSDKERAEHIMLVDLARNDLGRISRAGSVAVDERLTIEEYSHVMHLVSNVAGQLKRGVRATEVIRAVFPGGTITGCPKVRCMQLLRAWETVPRGVYTGSVGRLDFSGGMDLNIAIRTMVMESDRLSYHVGAGIVADSRPDREYHETLAKAQALVAALSAEQVSQEPSHAVYR